VISDLTLIDGSTARKLSVTKRIGTGFEWWTSSPGNKKYYAAFVDDLGLVLTIGGGVGVPKGVRPALKLDLSSVFFDSSSNTFGVTPYVVLKNTTTVVKFDNKDWYLIDYHPYTYTVTLLAKECVGASAYNTSGPFVEYSNSTVKTVVDSWYNNNITTDAKTAVSGDGMFLLTNEQAWVTTSEVRKCSQADGAAANQWWLSSRGGLFNTMAASVLGDSGDVWVIGQSVTLPLGVRPALNLKLSSVIFESASNTFLLLTDEPDTGSEFWEWTVDPENIGDLDGNTYDIDDDDVTITAVFEEDIKTLVTLKFEHYQQDGTPGVPKDIPDGLEFTLKLKAKKDGKTYEASAVMNSVEAGNRDSQAEFSFTEELDLSDGYDISLEFSPKTVTGKEIYGKPPIPGKTYTLTVTSLAPTKGKKEEGYCLKALMMWDDGTRHNPDDDIAIYALPEDEIGAYVILKDGTKEYLVFHTYDICMAWLGSDELCRGYERCFHKESPYVKP
jgi:hypothetical protein